MNKFILDIYNKLLASLDNHNEGFSARKLSAFIGIVTSIGISVKHSNPDNVDSLVITWLAFVAACLGMTTYQQINKDNNIPKV